MNKETILTSAFRVHRSKFSYSLLVDQGCDFDRFLNQAIARKRL
jgi:hypothetical protein